MTDRMCRATGQLPGLVRGLFGSIYKTRQFLRFAKVPPAQRHSRRGQDRGGSDPGFVAAEPPQTYRPAHCRSMVAPAPVQCHVHGVLHMRLPVGQLSLLHT